MLNLIVPCGIVPASKRDILLFSCEISYQSQIQYQKNSLPGDYSYRRLLQNCMFICDYLLLEWG